MRAQTSRFQDCPDLEHAPKPPRINPVLPARSSITAHCSKLVQALWNSGDWLFVCRTGAWYDCVNLSSKCTLLDNDIIHGKIERLIHTTKDRAPKLMWRNFVESTALGINFHYLCHSILVQRQNVFYEVQMLLCWMIVFPFQWRACNISVRVDDGTLGWCM